MLLAVAVAVAALPLLTAICLSDCCQCCVDLVAALAVAVGQVVLGAVVELPVIAEPVDVGLVLQLLELLLVESCCR